MAESPIALEIPADSIPANVGPLRAIPATETPTELGDQPSHGSCRIQVRGRARAAARAEEPLIVAIHAQDSGVRLAWQTLGQLPQAVTFDQLPLGRHQVYVGRCKACTRLAYLELLARLQR